jgi:hypothetical protein
VLEAWGRQEAAALEMLGFVTPAEDVFMFGDQVAAALTSVLGDDLVGAYFVGSVALGGYVAGQSDVDIVAVCREDVDEPTAREVVREVLETSRSCPARGLEFTLYRVAAVSAPRADTAFELNVNGGPGMAQSVHLSPQDEPRFWYVLDRAIAHRHGLPISGPPARAVFRDIPRRVLPQMMSESMRWHRDHERATLYSVLNGSRAWRFAVDDVLGSKLQGAEWARARWKRPSLIDAAVALRHGQPAPQDAEEVDGFLRHVERILTAAEQP